MNCPNDSLQVANTIAQQIGHRAFLMMGTRYKLGDANSLAFDVRGSHRCNKIKVTLDGLEMSLDNAVFILRMERDISTGRGWSETRKQAAMSAIPGWEKRIAELKALLH